MNQRLSQSVTSTNDVADEMVVAEEIQHALQISYPTFIRMVHRGDLPAKKVGGRWKMSRRKLREFMDSESIAVAPVGESE